MMKEWARRIFLERWQRKIVAVLIAIVVWALMNQAITVTKTISDVPVKVINIPYGKTIEGLLPSGYLENKMTLTVVGSKKTLDALDASDIEILINAEGQGDQWIAHVDKKSLISKNPNLDLKGKIKEVVQNDFIISLTPLVTAQIPIIILKPTGVSPPGYQFLDIWPQFLTQTVTGPEKQVQRLKTKGIKISFDISRISQNDLNKLASLDPENHEEVSFYIPDDWKKVAIPFLNNTQVPLNDPDSGSLRINFLKKTLLSLDTFIPVSLYFPAQTLKTFNPQTIHLTAGPLLKEEAGIFFLSEPLYAKDVSSLFLDIVRNHLQLVIVVSSKGSLEWSVDFVDLKGLEEAYIAASLAEHSEKRSKELPPHLKKDYLRNRFRTYVDQFHLFNKQKEELSLQPILKDQKIFLQ